jgi:predicted amino acid-binding ACT domain protein
MIEEPMNNADLQISTYVISIMARDRVGIIADVSQNISDLGGNITDIRQRVLCGYFTMILLVSFPEGITRNAVITKLSEGPESDLEIQVKPVLENAALPSNNYPDNTYVLTVTGSDQIGFVAHVSKFCKENHINILDLSTTSKADQYIMILFIDLTQSESIDLIRGKLTQFSMKTGFRVSLQHYNIFRAVNEIDLPIV